jgi:signal transduction histidine kinase
VLPVVVGAMLLFLLATLPLAVGLARRVDRAAAARTALIDRSLGALQDERRRIARVLHDGVIQDLSAAGYALAAMEQQGSLEGEILNGDDTATPDRVLSVHRLVPLLKDDVQQLRTVVGDLLETEVNGNTLQAALRGIQTRARVRFGLEMTLDVDPVVDTLPEPLAAAVFAVVREGLTNAGVHASASRVDVVVRRLQPAGTTEVAMADQGHRSSSDLLIVTVTDDGAGLPGANGTESPAPSSEVTSGVAEEPREHFGLRLLTRQLQIVQGTVSLTRAPGGGAVLTAMLPLSVAEV